jgi:undecaprenyl pyrophosphate phosphatase UppP
MLNEKEIDRMRYIEKIMRIKWRWILLNSLMFCCIGFVINCIIQSICDGKIDMSIREMLIALIQLYIIGFIFVFLWFNQHKKIYKKLKEKENEES